MERGFISRQYNAYDGLAMALADMGNKRKMPNKEIPDGAVKFICCNYFTSSTSSMVERDDR